MVSAYCEVSAVAVLLFVFAVIFLIGPFCFANSIRERR
jgi:hypothetical protein